MNKNKQKNLTPDDKDILMQQLTDNLSILRVKANLTQELIANAIGISRQTYCQIENKNRNMSWSVYMSLLFFFSSIPETSKLMVALGINSIEIINCINETIRNEK